jgi:magnesium chelatase family protein
VTVECHAGSGLPATTIVGLPEAAVRESRDRVASAIRNSGFEYPAGKVVINLAPGGLSKNSAALDLPIALSVLVATEQVSRDHLHALEFLGELGLFGELRPINGTLACALASRRDARCLIVPQANLSEVAVAPPATVSVAGDLRAVTTLLNRKELSLPAIDHSPGLKPDGSAPAPGYRRGRSADAQLPRQPKSHFDHVIGQQAAKRALTIAVAGGHHLLMVGPPGTGKTMLARSCSQLLPPLNEQARLEVAAVYSAAGIPRDDYAAAPFRDPHHSASAPALVGCGHPPAPGEIALAHHGVLFLDELPHFKPSALNLLREPIETGQAVIARAKYKVVFPCRFQLVAAMNPCPAGRTCNENACRCTPSQVQRYQSRISGPLLDRIDIQVQVPALSRQVLAKLDQQAATTQLASVKAQVERTRDQQLQRQGLLNAGLSGPALNTHIHAADLDRSYLEKAIARYSLSARSYHKLWRIARTIADLEGVDIIDLDHMAEAMSYRALDWEAGVG